MTVLLDLSCDVTGLLEGHDGGIVAVMEVLAGVPVGVEGSDVEANQRGAVAGGRPVACSVSGVRSETFGVCPVHPGRVGAPPRAPWAWIRCGAG